MDLLPLPSLSDSALRARSVSDEVIRAIRLVVTCLNQACDSVADDTGSDRFDDSTSEGQLRWRRCRNRARYVLDEQLIPGLERATTDVSDNALVILVGDCSISFYSARNGIHQPDLSGTSKTKGRVVNEMQMQLRFRDAPGSPKRLVIVYEADSEGLTRAAAGVLKTRTRWHWRVSAYERPGLTLADGNPSALPPPAYDEQPEVGLPDIEVRPAELDADLPAYDEQPEAEFSSFDLVEGPEDEEDADPRRAD